jgi:hypothetical protein
MTAVTETNRSIHVDICATPTTSMRTNYNTSESPMQNTVKITSTLHPWRDSRECIRNIVILYEWYGSAILQCLGCKYGSTTAKKVCTWYVDKAWRAELKKKIRDTALEVEVYKMLRMVLEQTSTRLFQTVPVPFLLNSCHIQRWNISMTTLSRIGCKIKKCGHSVTC